MRGRSRGWDARLSREALAAIRLPALAVLAVLLHLKAACAAQPGAQRPSAGASADEFASIRRMWMSEKAGVAATRATPPGHPVQSVASRPGTAAPAAGVRSSCAQAAGGAAAPAALRAAPGRTGPASKPGGGVIKPASNRPKTNQAQAGSWWRRADAAGTRGAAAGGQKAVRECTVTLAFVSKHRFAATSSFPPKEVSDAYKMNMGRYEAENKRWSPCFVCPSVFTARSRAHTTYVFDTTQHNPTLRTFPFEQYDKLFARLSNVARSNIPGFRVTLKGIPQGVMAVVREELQRHGSASLARGVGRNGTGVAQQPASRPASMANDSAAAKSSVGDLFDSVPAHVREHLMPFQREGVLFALSRQGRVLIGRLALLLACFARAGTQRGTCLPVVYPTE